MKRGLDWYKREPVAIRMAIMAARMTVAQAAVYSFVIDLIYEGGGETSNEPKHVSAHLSNMGTAKARTTIAELIAMEKLYVVVDMPRWPHLQDEAPLREAIAAADRGAVIARDGHRCAYCGSIAWNHEIDHIHPVSRGGSSHPNNLTVACRPCNRSKGARTVEEWCQ